QPFTRFLRDAGYYCTNASKQDYNFNPGANAWDESSGKAHYKNRKPGQPFFAVFNYTQSHESQFHGGRAFPGIEKHDPSKLTLPPYYPDTPLVRKDWAQNYDSITFVDNLIGKMLKELEEEGLAEDTIVFIWSDHGDGLPRAKRWLYDSGTRVPLLVRIPEKFRVGAQGKPGTVTDELILGPDLGMTVLNLAGVKVPDYAHGRAFLGKELSQPREYVFGARDRMDERYDIIRTARDKKYRYIRNFEPWKPYDQVIGYCEKGNVMKELRRAEAEGTLPPGAKLFMGERKPIEELYDSEADPHEINNLAAAPEHQATLKRMRAALEKWQEDTLDLAFLPEPIMNQEAAKAGSHWEILRKSGGAALVRDLRETATLYENGPSAIPELNKRLGAEHPAVRYWAVVGLTQLSLQKDSKVDTKTFINVAEKDNSPTVRVAAARALWLHKDVKGALPVLTDVLASKDNWESLAAALVLDEMGEAARPALSDIKMASKVKHEYLSRVVEQILANLKAE
ncbi:MAG: sulfatase-like hydrolase/transferase, partial [Phycisphaeraceae bacterium]